jgi:tetratricopeptide (TPR) repeat protein
MANLGPGRGRRPGGLRTAVAGSLLAMLASAPASARADVLDDIGKKLGTWDSEAQTLDRGLARPAAPTAPASRLQRRLIDAQVAFSVGRYEEAALMLYDVVQAGRGTSGRDYDTALYYLAESLFQKGDKVAARTYYTQLVAEVGVNSRFYQQSLERLIELSLVLRDPTGVEDWLAALDRVPADKRRASVPYVRGKYAFSLDQYDEALRWFAEVPKTSEYSFQAQYFTAVVHVAQKDLGKATQVFTDLLQRQPKTNDDRRVIELAQLALGRLYYEREQPSKAIDSYLLIDRKSDLFDEALYEVAWVYVKGKEFDKALRALELLALTDPTSSKLPTVRILEGNLRIRKAQTVKANQVMGMIQKEKPGDEYTKAETVFVDTHDTYAPAHDELAKIIAANADPQQFLAQITGRTSATFEVNATMPDLAASWIREEPDVQRVVAIESDLGEVQSNIADAEETIARLEATLSSPARVNIYPTLATKRNRASDLLESVALARRQLSDEETRLARKYAQGTEAAELDRLRAQRQDIVARADQGGDPGVALSDRAQRARDDVDGLDQQASEVQVTVETTQATAVAINKYIDEATPPPTKPQKLTYQKTLAELKPELEGMRTELDAIRRELVIARDQAGVDDAEQARRIRSELKAALDAEHAAASRILARQSGADRQRADRIATLMASSDRVSVRLDQAIAAIDAVVDAALVDVRDTVQRERAELGAYRREFLTAEAESRALGGTVLGESFRQVKTKFYDVLIRTDVGVVDVSWSQKEDTDEDLRKMTLDKQREVKQLRDEFNDLIEEDSAGATGGTP